MIADTENSVLPLIPAVIGVRIVVNIIILPPTHGLASPRVNTMNHLGLLAKANLKILLHLKELDSFETYIFFLKYFIFEKIEYDKVN